MHASATILADFAAWTIVAPLGIQTLTHDDEVAVKINGQYRPCSVGTVSGYAAEYRDDEAAAVARAKERGHKLFWINPQASVLSATPRAKRVFIGLSFGDVVNIRCSVEGTRSFTLRRAANGNIRLEPVTRHSGGRTPGWTPNGASGASVNPAEVREAAARKTAADAWAAAHGAYGVDDEEQEYSIVVATEYVVRVPAGCTLEQAKDALLEELNLFEGEELELELEDVYGDDATLRTEQCATWIQLG